MKQTLLFLIYASLLLGCASIQPLDGGEKDSEPPKILKCYPDSASVYVSTNKFYFEFDEYVKLNNPNNLFIISPAQTINPEFKIKGKQLIIELKDSLLDNTTYSIQFNGGIIDLNEGNPLEQYTYVYSTGSYLDSLQLKFKVTDYRTKKSCSDCKVQLYYSSNDSVILRDKPAYVGFTNDYGVVHLQNLADTSFNVYALQDDNKNFKLENNELISLKTVLKTSNIDTTYPITVFPYQSSLDKPKHHKTTNSISNFVFKNSVYQTVTPIIDDSILTSSFLGSDTLSVLHGELQDTTILQLLANTDTFTYSIIPNIRTIPRFKYIERSDFGFTLHYNNILDYLNSDTIRFRTDSVFYSLDSITTHNNELYLFTKTSGESYQFFIPKSLLNRTDTSQLLDTIRYSTLNKVSLSLVLEEFDEKVPKIIYLNKNSKTLKTLRTSNSKVTLFDLQPGTYTIAIAEDLNKNQVWDTGNPFIGLEPEPFQVSTDFELRLNWDNQFTIKKL